MATIKDDYENDILKKFMKLSGEDLEKAKNCSVCGLRGDAFWSGATHFVVCLDCALTVLPALMADAINKFQYVDYNTVELRIMRAKVNFYKALYLSKQSA